MCVDRAECLREIDGADRLVKRVVGVAEVLGAHFRAVFRETLAEIQERTLDGARDLIAKFRITHASLADAAREREGDLVDVETLKRESVV